MNKGSAWFRFFIVYRYSGERLKQVIYISTAVKVFIPQEVQTLVSLSQMRNKEEGVTGVLLYDNCSTFIQVLEGDDKSVERVMFRIKADTRHKDVLVIHDEAINERTFSVWSMAYKTIPDNADLQGFIALSRLKQQISSNQLLLALINKFELNL
jgi:hypothetical protein